MVAAIGRVRSHIAFAALVMLPAACTEPVARREEILVPKALLLLAGDRQEAEVGTPLPQLIELRVTDSLGRSVVRVPVSFAIFTVPGAASPGGSVDPPVIDSDDLGVVRARWTLGTTAGRQTLRVSIGTAGGASMTSVHVNALALPGVATSVARRSDSVTTITVGDSAHVALAGRDRYGNVTSRLPGLAWHVRDPGVAAISREIPQDAAAIVVARTRGTTRLEARDATVGTLVFEVRALPRSPGGELAYSSANGIHVMSADGTRVTTLTSEGGSPVWSPDGRRIAFLRRVQGTLAAIYVTNADGSGVRALTDPSKVGSAMHQTWSPDGQQIAFTGSVGSSTAIYTVNADGSNAGALTDPATLGVAREPAWSPDGRKIAFVAPVRELSPVTTFGVYLMNADGSAQTRLAFIPCLSIGSCAGAQRPVWSPDGTRIAFANRVTACLAANIGRIGVVNADGTASRDLSGAGFASAPVWSPDGQRIAYRSASVSISPGNCAVIGPSDLYVVNVAGSGRARLTTASASGASDASQAWSPDGTRIAFRRTGTAQGGAFDGVYVMNADGSDARRIVGGATDPAWRPVP